MKKVLALSITFLFAVSVVIGQATKKARVPLKKLEGKDVSIVSKNNFATEYGNVPNVKWVRSSNFDEATFIKDGKEMRAFFDDEGNLVGTTSHVKFADLPEKAQKEIKAKYNDYSINPAIVFFDDNEKVDTDMILYGTQFEDADNYFVELSKGTKRIVLQVNPEGMVTFFKELSK